MNLVVDTSVWSLFLRRHSPNGADPFVAQLRYYLQGDNCIHILGQILQELLDGVRERKQFDLLRDYLEPFPLLELDRADFVEASRLRNHCRSHGVQARPTDFLIAAGCIRRNYPLLTADGDFGHIAKYCKLGLISVQKCFTDQSFLLLNTHPFHVSPQCCSVNT